MWIVGRKEKTTPKRKTGLRKLLLLAASLPLGVIVLFTMVVLFAGIILGPWSSTRRVGQMGRIAGFSVATADPASYWGQYSVIQAVKSERFDEIIVNATPDGLFDGYVVIGRSHGKIISFYIESTALRRIVVNGKTFDLSWNAFLRGGPKSEYEPIARDLSMEEIGNLGTLSALWLKNCREMQRQSGRVLDDRLREFTKRYEMLHGAKAELLKRSQAD